MENQHPSENLSLSNSALNGQHTCSVCGKAVSRPIRFCNSCGAPLNTSNLDSGPSQTALFASSTPLPQTEAVEIPSALLNSNQSTPLPGTSEVLVVPGFHTNDLIQTAPPEPDEAPKRTTTPLKKPQTLEQAKLRRWVAIACIVLASGLIIAAFRYSKAGRASIVQPQGAQNTPTIPAQTIHQTNEKAGSPTPVTKRSTNSSSPDVSATSTSPGSASGTNDSTHPGSSASGKPDDTASSSSNNTTSSSDTSQPGGTTAKTEVSKNPTTSSSSPASSSTSSSTPTSTNSTHYPSRDTDTSSPRRSGDSNSSEESTKRRTDSSSDPDQTVSNRRRNQRDPNRSSDPDEPSNHRNRRSERSSTHPTDDDDDDDDQYGGTTPHCPNRKTSPDNDTGTVSRRDPTRRSTPSTSNTSGSWSGKAYWSGFAGKQAQVYVYGFPGLPVSVSRPMVKGGQARIVMPPSPSNGWRYAIVEFEKGAVGQTCEVTISWQKL